MSPTSTTSAIRKVVRDTASPTTEGATLLAPNKRSCVSLAVFLGNKTFSQPDFRSAITGPASTPIALQWSTSELCRREPAAAMAVFSIKIRVSKKKFLSLKGGLRTKSWTHATPLFISSWSFATSMRDTVKVDCDSDGSLTTSHKCCHLEGLKKMCRIIDD